MITKRNTLALAVVASFGIAAAPAQAQETNTAAAVGAIDMSKVAAPTQTGEDAQFKQLFAQWDNLDRATPAATSVSVPSRMPLDNTKLTSDYGMRTHPVLGGRRNHKGVDLAAPVGTPIYATADGYVSKAEWFSSYGKFVSIEHGADLQTRFAHMSGITVKAGTRVKKGDVIGYVGSTGRSTGPHLHYEVRIAGKAVNPVPYMVESEAQRAFALATGTGGQGDGDDN
ncbi:MAG TPA: M23 family peptidase [Erythrobacter sp.]|nr:M23 family peptidase [Erythrobacter sp.]